MVKKLPPPELDMAYKKGYDSFWKVEEINGYWNVVANPLKKNTIQYKEWERGKIAAYEANLKKVKKREQTRAGS